MKGTCSVTALWRYGLPAFSALYIFLFPMRVSADPVATAAGSSQASPERAATAAPNGVPLLELVALELLIEDPAWLCPSRELMASWVDELVGRPFVSSVASERVVVQVSAGTAVGQQASVFRSGQADSAGVLVRTFPESSSCEDLLRTAALSISLMAKDKPGITKHAEPEGAANPLESWPVRLDSQAPLAQPKKPRVRVKQKSRARDPRAATANWEVAAEIGGVFSVGINPGVGVGSELSGILRRGGQSLALHGTYLWGTGDSYGEETEIRGNVWAASVGACQRFGNSLDVCGVGSYLSLAAHGVGFDVNKRTKMGVVGLGAEV